MHLIDFRVPVFNSLNNSESGLVSIGLSGCSPSQPVYARECLSLPLFGGMTEAQVEQACEALRNSSAKRRSIIFWYRLPVLGEGKVGRE
jgi:hypothetical protein